MLRLLRACTLPTALLILAAVGAPALSAQGFDDAPAVALKGVPFALTVAGPDEPGPAVPFEIIDARGQVVGSGVVEAQSEAVVDDVVIDGADALPMILAVGGVEEQFDPTLLNGWFSLLPPLLAVLLALIFREVVTALVAGVWLGALAVAGFNPIQATWRMIDTFIVPAVADGSHASIIVFSMLLGGMVGLVSKNGGTMGIVEALAPLASTRRRGKIATWAAGLAIFFDDYANTLIVGNTMRPITDRLKISREKLAYLVDSTAAPVAALVPISTWVGYEISLIADGIGIAEAQNPGNTALVADLTSTSPFLIFIHTIPYLFYPLLALAFVFLTSVMDRDWGPMAAAERRAASGGGLFRPGAQLTMDTESGTMDAKEGAPHRWWNAAAPVLTVILVVLAGLYTTGAASSDDGASLMDIFGAADPFATLLWGSLAGCLVAFALSVGQRILTLNEAIEAWLDGIRAMMIAMIVLTLAWSLGAVTEAVGTASYLAGLLEGSVPLQLMPWLVFVTAAAMAFATGTSWGTMAILIPLVIPLTVTLGGAADFAGGAHYSVLLGSISSVLAGAIFGDHCSPISDTTVLSSTASACDHVDHVRTQLPYALLVAAVSMLLGDIGTAYGLPNIVALLGGVLVLWAFLRFRGVRVSEPESR
ncbi:Na+/H+ antiporter NhaC family protein [Gemmatimonadota bacterium Y43]|uniref:Na+/H+ antiporter NhaC family protein n=1 Tax=Gaopeijia maritima TaxID=3119007 RepID=UPI003283EBC6